MFVYTACCICIVMLRFLFYSFPWIYRSLQVWGVFSLCFSSSFVYVVFWFHLEKNPNCSSWIGDTHHQANHQLTIDQIPSDRREQIYMSFKRSCRSLNLFNGCHQNLSRKSHSTLQKSTWLKLLELPTVHVDSSNTVCTSVYLLLMCDPSTLWRSQDYKNGWNTHAVWILTFPFYV